MGFIIVPVLLLCAIIYAALPFILAVIIVAMLPGVGDLRSTVSGWSLLHFVWMIPALFFIETIAGAAAKVLKPKMQQGSVADIVGGAVVVVVLASFSSVFFADDLGAVLTAALAFGLSLVVQKILPEPSDKSTEPDDTNTPALSP